MGGIIGFNFCEDFGFGLVVHFADGFVVEFIDAVFEVGDADAVKLLASLPPVKKDAVRATPSPPRGPPRRPPRGGASVEAESLDAAVDELQARAGSADEAPAADSDGAAAEAPQDDVTSQPESLA